MVGWLGAVRHSFRSISVVFVAPSLLLQTLQTSFAVLQSYRSARNCLR